ncbi:MAG: DNA/RNA non-specific endonuclease [Gordonia sp. (in: high G+C Gram-positive bacteria)]|uniref:DNA/RNA non-specific endonuclease n=1 Tax=Gordonia sp. (in: high G+C Gram-positive bacteria) TaxID=84139 RepID=UPI003BB7B2E6
MGRTSEETSHQRTVSSLGDSGTNRHGAITGDHAGHIAAHRFILDQGLPNLFAQNGTFNTSAYKKMENEWAALVNDGLQVEGTVKFRFDSTSDRLNKVMIDFEGIKPGFEGEVVFSLERDPIFENSHGEEYGRSCP